MLQNLEDVTDFMEVGQNIIAIDTYAFVILIIGGMMLESAPPFEHMNLTPRPASPWFRPTRFQISAFVDFHFS